jgi:hypothetical protein
LNQKFGKKGEQMRILKIFMIITIIGTWLLVFGCGALYEESDDLISKTWDLMTVKEKQIYDLVEDQWGKSVLKQLRESVRTRLQKPSEEDVPFSTMGDIIRTIEKVQLIIKSDWSTDTIKSYNNAKFSAIDPAWYYSVIAKTKDKTENKIKDVQITPFSKPKVQHMTQHSGDNVDFSQLIAVEEYGNLKWQMRDCLSAKQLLNDIISQGRPLTVADREQY